MKFVKVIQITDHETALCADPQGDVDIEVPLFPQRAKGGLPQPGETWILDRAVGRWVFSHVLVPLGAWNSPFEVVEALPAATAGRRGQIIFVQGADGVADTLRVCLKSAGDTYSWKTLQTG
jgi:hypothetical protein